MDPGLRNFPGLTIGVLQKLCRPADSREGDSEQVNVVKTGKKHFRYEEVSSPSTHEFSLKKIDIDVLVISYYRQKRPIVSSNFEPKLPEARN